MNVDVDNRRKCNCRDKDLCPFDGECLTSNVVYEATVTTTSGDSKDIENNFKTRCNNHKLSFKDRKLKTWDLRDSNTSYEIKPFPLLFMSV